MSQYEKIRRDKKEKVAGLNERMSTRSARVLADKSPVIVTQGLLVSTREETKAFPRSVSKQTI